jgi:hypothetical protein
VLKLVTIKLLKKNDHLKRKVKKLELEVNKLKNNASISQVSVETRNNQIAQEK